MTREPRLRRCADGTWAVVYQEGATRRLRRIGTRQQARAFAAGLRVEGRELAGVGGLRWLS